jgi:hypothetical protein
LSEGAMMSIQTPTQNPAPATRRLPTASLDYFAEQHRLRTPAYLPQDVEPADVYREFLRLPTLLWIPVSVALLVYVALHSFLLMVPCAVVLSTITSFSALARARARLAERHLRALTMGLIPVPRSGTDS